MDSLPQELVVLILDRLSVNELARNRLVCKSFDDAFKSLVRGMEYVKKYTITGMIDTILKHNYLLGVYLLWNIPPGYRVEMLDHLAHAEWKDYRFYHLAIDQRELLIKAFLDDSSFKEPLTKIQWMDTFNVCKVRDLLGVIKTMIESPRCQPQEMEEILFSSAIDCDTPHLLAIVLQCKKFDPCCDMSFAFLSVVRRRLEPMVIEFLKDGRVDPCMPGAEPLWTFAFEYGSPLTVALIKHPTVDLSFRNDILLRDACLRGDLKFVKYLLRDKRVNPAADDNSPLQRAFVKKHFMVVSLLLDNESVDSSIILYESCDKGYYKLVCKLLRHPKIDMVARGVDCVLTAVKKNYVKIVKELMRSDTIPLEADEHKPFLECVMAAKSDKVLTYLFKSQRIIPGAKDHKCLKMLIMKANIKMIRVLLKHPKFVFPSELLLDDILTKAKRASEIVTSDHDMLTPDAYQKIFKILDTDPRNSKFIKNPKKRKMDIVPHPITDYFKKRKTVDNV